ncbi:lipoprotein [Micromonospora sp. NPDC007271]|uniref:lipoprotein n=1 Tax=Micromonospora sp. NPDC007271 TaxID=3154587 RepID=UPI0033FC21E6
MTRRFAVLTALVLAALTGCADETPPPAGSAGRLTAAPVADGPPWYDEIGPAPAAGTVDAVGGCQLPVSFALAERRVARQARIPEPEVAEALGSLVRRGGVSVRCEIDGHLARAGFMRVWTSDRPATEPRPVLEAYVAAGERVSDPTYRTVRAGTVDAVEATWTSMSELTGTDEREWALAVPAGQTIVLLTTNESIVDEAADVLPGYRLAVRTLSVTG